MHNIITVKNTDDFHDTTAEIEIQNKLDYIPKVSVIIPVYNVEGYLKECLESVINQTLKEIEMICIDDGSTDSSLAILKEYAQKDNRITVLKQENFGAGIARNACIGCATGEYVTFMDSDDFYPNNGTLERMYSKAVANNVKICGGSLNQLKDGEIIKDSSKFEEGYTFKLEGIIKYKDYQYDYGYGRFIYKLDFLKENNCLFPNYLRGEDPPFFIRTMCLAENFYALKEPTYVYRVSYKEVDWNVRRTEGTFKSLRDCLKFAKQYHLSNLMENIYKRLNNTWLLEKIVQYLKNPIIIEVINEIKSLVNDDNSISELLNYCKPKISVIISVYNTEDYLRECLDSVINQTLNDIEIICVNDGSTDDSLGILKEYASKDERVKIIDQKNQGLASSRNNALKIATGQYIQFFDSDDILELDTCEILFNKCRKYNLDMLSFGGNNFDNETKEEQYNSYYNFEYLPKNWNKESFNYLDARSFMQKMAVSSCLTIYKKELIDKYAITFPDGLCFEDNVFFLKALTNAKKIGIEKTRLYKRRIHSESITQNWDKHFADFLKISDLVLSYLKSIQIDNGIYNVYKNAYINQCIRRYNSFCDADKEKYKKVYKSFLRKYEIEYKFLERIFSVKNSYNKKYKVVTFLGIKVKSKKDFLQKLFSVKNVDVHKVITILGVKLKFKSKKLVERKRINSLETQLQNAKKDVNRLLQNSKISQIAFETKWQQQETTIENLQNERKILLLEFEAKWQRQEDVIKGLCNEFSDLRRGVIGANEKITSNYSLLKNDLQSLRNDFIYKIHKYCPDNKRAEALSDWFFERTGNVLNLQNPQTFNEKIQWLKLYDSTPVKTRLADKYLVRDWVKEKIGEEYLIPLLGVWDNFDDINFNELPEQFVLKCNHASGYNIIVKDKVMFNIDEARKKFNKWMREDFAYRYGLELHYSAIPRKIIAEEYVINANENLYDYKFWCFNGQVKYMQFRDDFSANLKMVFYDLNWNKQDFYYDHPLYEEELKKPERFDEMVKIAQTLCQGFPFVCVDLYVLNDGSIKFGEMTFTRSSGAAHWCSEEINLKLGKMINIPSKQYQ